MPQAAVTENFSNQLPVSELELNFHATTRETAANITRETYRSPRKECPSWSLPPPPSWSLPSPEENLKKQNAKKDTAEGKNGHDSLPGNEGETRNGAEHYDDTENNGLLTELQKVFYYLQFHEINYLINDFYLFYVYV